MKKSLISIIVAIFLGIVTMIMPILALTQISSVGQNTFGPTEQVGSDNSSFRTLDEAAKTLGTLETSSSFFPISLMQAVLLSSVCLTTAGVISLIIKRKMLSTVKS